VTFRVPRSRPGASPNAEIGGDIYEAVEPENGLLPAIRDYRLAEGVLAGDERHHERGPAVSRGGEVWRD
jgi:hypothetical protein